MMGEVGEVGETRVARNRPDALEPKRYADTLETECITVYELPYTLGTR